MNKVLDGMNELKHVSRALPGGGMVLLLDTGALLSPEVVAMLQALYSRDPGGVMRHLIKVASRGAEKFMTQYYVGYGHKSIADCGTVTLFIEGVSMLVAKAIQDWMLYSGQEASSRYLDFKDQPFVNPFGVSDIHSVLRTFYIESFEPVRAWTALQFPCKSGQNPDTWAKAIKARTFDILRGFLPAGASTNLSWHSNLRQISDHLDLLYYHPLEEVRDVAKTIFAVMHEAFPSSFPTPDLVDKLEQARRRYNSFWMNDFYLYTNPSCPDFEGTSLFVDVDRLSRYRDVLLQRPRKVELPKFLGQFAQFRFDFQLDFGSFRDVQRHRAVNQRMPLLDVTMGFEDWYLNQLPADVYARAVDLIEWVTKRCLELPELIRQYYVPMGFLCPCVITGDLPASAYLAELRATPLVHPTLQRRAGQMGQFMRDAFTSYTLPPTVFLYEGEAGMFDVRRGKQDIVRVEI